MIDDISLQSEQSDKMYTSTNDIETLKNLKVI